MAPLRPTCRNMQITICQNVQYKVNTPLAVYTFISASQLTSSVKQIFVNKVRALLAFSEHFLQKYPGAGNDVQDQRGAVLLRSLLTLFEKQ